MNNNNGPSNRYDDNRFPPATVDSEAPQGPTLQGTFQIGPTGRLQEVQNLATVAEMMNNFVRDENAAYEQLLFQRNRQISILQRQLQFMEAQRSEYLRRLNSMASIIVYDQEIFQDQDFELGEHVEIIYDTHGVPDARVVINLADDEDIDWDMEF